jgi:hypothetical protein
MGFRPEILSRCRTPGGDKVVVFNFGMTSAGPVQELLCLRRLLAAGLRPKWVFVEVFAPFLNQEAGQGNRTWLGIDELSWVDLPVLRRYCERPWLMYGRWLWSRAAAGSSYRLGLMKQHLPKWLPASLQFDVWLGITAYGWVPFAHDTVSAADYRRGLERARVEYYRLLHDFLLRDSPTRALRELLELCRREDIGVGLFLMPEGSEFRSWYPPAVEEMVSRYLAGLSKEYGVPVVDARRWMPDANFFDGHHLLPRGATAFTKRFERAALEPFLLGKLPAGYYQGPEAVGETALARRSRK